MSPHARLYIISGLLIIFLLFATLALSGYLSRWERFTPFVVKGAEVK